jgi:hypothetical protein
MARIRDGEWIAGAGGAALLVSLFLPWYGGGRVEATAWQALGVLDVVLALLALVPLTLVVLQATRASPTLPVVFSVLSVPTAALATLLVLVRLIDQPGPNALVEVEIGAWLALVAALVATAGGWRSLRVEDIPGVALPPIEELPAPVP